jgi:hypothetical protein
MPEEGFLRRWARVKATGGDAEVEAPPRPAAPVAAPAPPPAHSVAPAAASQNALTLDDAAQLTSSSDFSAFVSQGVDQDVRRLALKKLFADPHFNVMDRLDMYMDDYNKPSPVSAAMLAALQHARSALRRPEEVQAELARLAALEPPPHPKGVAQPMPVRAVPVETSADDAGETSPIDEPLPEGDLPDADTATDDPAIAPVSEDACPDPHPVDEDNDAIALTIVRAHNAVTRP